MILVVCGIITKNSKVLICKRKPGKSMAGFWEFPGGKIESNELPEEALKRELLEELGMKVELHNYFTTIVHSYKDLTISLIAYKCKFQEATFNLTDHDAYKWIDILDLLNWKLAEADIPIAKKLINEITDL
jgi:8-oxo-dGTP diphosphatase